MSKALRVLIAVLIASCSLACSGPSTREADIPGFRRCLEDIGTVESYAVAIKDRYKPVDKQYIDFRAEYTVAFASANGYLNGLAGTVDATESLRVSEEDYNGSTAAASLANAKKSGQTLLGTGIGPEGVIGAGEVVSAVRAIVEEIVAWNDKRTTKAVQKIKDTIARHHMLSFEQVAAASVKAKYAE